MLKQVVITLLLLGGQAPGSRIVSTSPQTTELLFQLGLGPNVVGTSQFSDYPESAKTLPQIGPLFNPGVERSVRLRPDWIVGDPETNNPFFLDACKVFGVRHLELGVGSPEELLRSALEAGNTLGSVDLTQRLAPFQKCIEETRKQKRPKFTFLVFAWLDPPVLFSDGTLLSSLIGSTGGVNVFPGLSVNFPQVTHEWLMKRNVDRMFVLSDALSGSSVENSKARWWPNKSVAKIVLPSKYFSRSSLTPLSKIEMLTLPFDHALPRSCGDGELRAF